MFRKIFLLAFLANILLVTIISSIYINDVGNRELKLFIEQSQSLALSAEAIRDERAALIQEGIIDFNSLVAQGDKERILKAVPILSAISFAKNAANISGKEFRTPKLQPRNPVNEPDAFEKRVLEMFEKDNLPEYHEIQKAENHIHYFRPIRLTADCLVCHGDPAGELDPVGYAKEGWKTGQVVAAFEVSGSLLPILEKQSQIALTIGLLSLLMLAATGTGLFLIVKRMVRPIGSYMLMLQKASEGDLTGRLNIRSKDEIGNMANRFNQFVDQLSGLLRHTKNLSSGSVEKSETLKTHAQDISTTGSDMHGKIRDMDSSIKKLDGEIETTLSSTATLQSFLGDLKAMIIDQSNAVINSSSAVEEIVASIHNIARTAEDKIVVSRKLEQEAAEGINDLNNTMDLIGKTADSTQSIMEMTVVIQKIAAQTNILAMNAAIEAAHAGNAGMGFAVVADEIRKLSESAGSSAKKISQTVKEIFSFTEKTRHASENTVGRFNQIAHTITAVAQSMLELQQSTKELSEGSNLILNQNQALLESGDKTKNSSQEVEKRLLGIVEAMNSLKKFSAQSREQFIVMGQLIQTLATMAANISELGNANQTHMMQLQGQLQAFKIDAEK